MQQEKKEALRLQLVEKIEKVGLNPETMSCLQLSAYRAEFLKLSWPQARQAGMLPNKVFKAEFQVQSIWIFSFVRILVPVETCAHASMF